MMATFISRRAVIAIMLLVATLISGRRTCAVTGTFVGLGVQLKATSEGAVIERVIPRGPAEAAGLAEGVIIVEIDGTSIRGMTLPDILARLGGPQGTVVRLKVRKDDNLVTQLEVTRQRFTLSGRAIYDGGYKWVQDVVKQVGPYLQIKQLVERVGESRLTAYDPGSFVEWIQDEFGKSQSTDIPGKRDVLFKALDVAAAMSADKRFGPLMEYWLDATVATAEQLKIKARPGFLTIHKLYNEGVILRTSGACLGIDLFFPPQTPPSVVQAFADHLDGLLITHTHQDHMQDNLIQLLKQKGKPVEIAPEKANVPVGGKLASGSIGAAHWTSFCGRHIMPTFSGYYSVTISDWHIIHSGDNTVWPPAFMDSEYADRVDVFFVKLESQSPRAVSRIRPRFFVPQHLLELYHGTDAYGHDALGMRQRQANTGQSRLLMLQWGDKYEIAASPKGTALGTKRAEQAPARVRVPARRGPHKK